MTMTLEDAIIHAEAVAEENEKNFRLCPYPSQECSGTQDCRCLKNGEDKGCLRCAAEHRQLAAWLRELKAVHDKSDDANGSGMISIQTVIDELRKYFHDEYYQRTSIQDCIRCFIEDVLTPYWYCGQALDRD